MTLNPWPLTCFKPQRAGGDWSIPPRAWGVPKGPGLFANTTPCKDIRKDIFILAVSFCLFAFKTLRWQCTTCFKGYALCSCLPGCGFLWFANEWMNGWMDERIPFFFTCLILTEGGGVKGLMAPWSYPPPKPPSTPSSACTAGEERRGTSVKDWVSPDCDWSALPRLLTTLD